MPPSSVAAVLAPAFLSGLVDRVRGSEAPFVLGVSGAQGSGKSTLCAQLVLALGDLGLRVVTVSLDDLYLTRAERTELGRRVHPLCAIRGAPGTHDVVLGLRLLDDLARAAPQQRTAVVRFDKASDDRVSMDRFDVVVGRPDVILFEGWCVGVMPGPPWTGPINDRERRDDPTGEWVRWSEAALVSSYLGLWERLDALLLIEVAGFEAVVEGRWRQEEALRERLSHTAEAPGVGVMTRAEVEDYVALFERKTRQCLAELPGAADWVVPAWAPG